MTRILKILQSPERLLNNYERLLSSKDFSPPSDSTQVGKLDNLPTTHSFGYEKIFYLDVTKNITRSVFPAKSILFQHKAFLSDSSRDKVAILGDTQPKREMTKAREFGLDEFVFAYLGVHEYYYTQCQGINVPAFGAFFKASLDLIKPLANATLYDLESPLASPYKPEDIVLTAQNARELTLNEISNSYSNDFYDYWICEGYISKGILDGKKWARKREFHYHEKVDVSELTALLWPLELRYDPVTEKAEIRGATIREIRDFKSTYPDVQVFTYIWIGEEGEDRFTFGSHLIAKELLEVGALPFEGNFLDEFHATFPFPKL